MRNRIFPASILRQAKQPQQAFTNPLSDVCGTQWPNSYRSIEDLCSRAWCRLELLLCAALPLRDGGFRYVFFSVSKRLLVERMVVLSYLWFLSLFTIGLSVLGFSS